MQKIFCLIFIVYLLFCASPLHAQQNFLAYNMALIHTQNLNPEKVFLKKNIKPEQALISEFQWILDSLEPRCLNPERTIADTIVETWIVVKSNNLPLTLLEVARELSHTAKNTNAFGVAKVNFRMTSQFWLTNTLARQITNKTNNVLKYQTASPTKK